MDLRTWTENPVKNENKKKVLLSSNESKDTDNIKINVLGQIERATEIYHKWQSTEVDGTNYEIPELYRSVTIDEIEEKGWTLTPSKYIEFIDHDLDIDFDKEMKRIQSEMSEIISKEEKSQKMLKEAFEEIGYGIKEN